MPCRPAIGSRRFSASPAVLIESLGDDDFASAVLEGWTQAAVAFSTHVETAAWLAPLWNYWLPLAGKGLGVKTGAARGHAASLLQAMSAAEAESCLQGAMAAGGEAELLVAELLVLLPRPWSPGFTRLYLRHATDAVQRRGDSTAYRWVCTLSHAAKAIPSASFRASNSQRHFP